MNEVGGGWWLGGGGGVKSANSLDQPKVDPKCPAKVRQPERAKETTDGRKKIGTNSG